MSFTTILGFLVACVAIGGVYAMVKAAQERKTKKAFGILIAVLAVIVGLSLLSSLLPGE